MHVCNFLPQVHASCTETVPKVIYRTETVPKVIYRTDVARKSTVEVVATEEHFPAIFQHKYTGKVGNTAEYAPFSTQPTAITRLMISARAVHTMRSPTYCRKGSAVSAVGRVPLMRLNPKLIVLRRSHMHDNNTTHA